MKQQNIVGIGLPLSLNFYGKLLDSANLRLVVRLAVKACNLRYLLLSSRCMDNGSDLRYMIVGLVKDKNKFKYMYGNLDQSRCIASSNCFRDV